jgi:hypothetical protein
MNDSARTQGVLICVGAVALGLLFSIGLLSGSWWSVAIPVAVLLTFVLGLTFWVGWTIATVQVEPEAPPAHDPGEGAGVSDTSA